MRHEKEIVFLQNWTSFIYAHKRQLSKLLYSRKYFVHYTVKHLMREKNGESVKS